MRLRRIVLLSLIAVFMIANVSYASIPFDSYIYYSWSETYPTPPAYEPVDQIYGEDMGCGPLSNPDDIFAAPDGDFYIADTGNHRIIELGPDFKVKKVIDKFINSNGEEDTFNEPKGVFVEEDGDIYIADTKNTRIVILNKQGELIRVIDKPVHEIIPTTYEYLPQKVAVDKTGRIYVAAQNAIDGLFQFTPSGVFERFFGATRVKVNPIELLWRKFYTKAQKERMSLFLASEYSNITIDKDGFIYATIKGRNNEQIRRLNAEGNDIIRHNEITSTRFGDLINVRVGSDVSQFVDVSVDEYGNMLALDFKQDRIFQYNILGDLLSVTGGKGRDTVGLFDSPVAVEQKDDMVFVVDSVRNCVVVLKATEFGRKILEANRLYIDGKYEEALKPWQDVLKMCGNYELAYVGIGKTLYKQEKFKEAMEYFELGNNREGYSKALKEYRNMVLRDNFSLLMTLLLLFVILVNVLAKLARKYNLSFKRLYGENY